MTVQELIDFLGQFNPDHKIFMGVDSHELCSLKTIGVIAAGYKDPRSDTLIASDIMEDYGGEADYDSVVLYPPFDKLTSHEARCNRFPHFR